MKLQITELAYQKLLERFGQHPLLLKLLYDTEGCGCAVNGIAQFHLMDAPSQADEQLDVNIAGWSVWIDKKHTVFFEEKLKLDFSLSQQSFILKSDSQYYNCNLWLTDKRTPASQP